MSFRRYFCGALVSALPPTRAYWAKTRMWRWAGVEIAEDARIVSSVRILTSGRVVVGSGSFLGHEVLLVGGDASIEIGPNCDIGPRVMIVTGSHEDGGEARAAGRGFSRPVRIGAGVWVGAGSTILGDVEIGEGTTIGAGSLVNASIPARSVAFGVPCRVVRGR